MKENRIYNKEYYDNIYNLGQQEIDENFQKQKAFMSHVAKKIYKEFSPKTVLDVGCSFGHLVENLRDLGVEAYGVDISDAAINCSREDIRPYLSIQSVLDDLPKDFPAKYDLVISIEMLEHLPENLGNQAIEKISDYADTLVISTSPIDLTDPTHFNVQQQEYWLKRFAQQNLYRNMFLDVSYITPWAFCVERNHDILEIIEQYERTLRITGLNHKNEMEQAKNKEKKITAHAYWDFGTGFSEHHVVAIENLIQNGALQGTIELPLGTKKVRFDPLEGTCCAVKNFEVYGDYKQITDVSTNGFSNGNTMFFATNDPQILIPNTEGLKTLQIQGQLIEIDEQFVHSYIKDVVEVAEQVALQKDTIANQAEDIAMQNAAIVKQSEEIAAQKATITQINTLLAEMQSHDTNMAEELEHYTVHYHAAIAQREALKQELVAVRQQWDIEVQRVQAELVMAQISYAQINNAFFWKITKPLRVLCDGTKRLLHKWRVTHLMMKGLRNLKNNGMKDTMFRTKMKLSVKSRVENYQAAQTLTEEERATQENTKFQQSTKFSIVVPLYNTPENFLIEMIQSVQGQTYGNWELCLADGSDNGHGDVKKIVMALAKDDSRIRYEKLEKNLGIAENTNACLQMATGDFIGLFDHDDLLHPSALFEIMTVLDAKQGAVDFFYTDEDKTDEHGQKYFDAFYKPDFSPDMLRSQNYICHFTVFRRSLLDTVGYFSSEYNGSQDHDMILRLTEATNRIVHIPKVLYHWRVHSASTAGGAEAKDYTTEAGIKAVQSHIDRMGLKGTVVRGLFPNSYRVNYDIVGNPKISILIPNKDGKEDLEKCIQSVQRSTYQNYEIIVIENNSTTQEIRDYYEELESIENVKVVYWTGIFNYSAINNFGATYATGEYYVLLNNDIELITPSWMEEMLMHCQRDGVGIVGAKLCYPDETLQHAGVIVGLGGVAGHSHKCFPRNHLGYFNRLGIVQNLSAVTAACLMVPKAVFDNVNGLDEAFQVAFNDVDFCLRVRAAGQLVIYTPFAEAYHYESKSRGYEDTPEKQARFQGEINRFQGRWNQFLAAGDPYYSPNLTLDREDFGMQ